MRSNRSRPGGAEPGRIWRALHARGVGWVVLAVYAAAALVAWLCTLSIEGLATSVPVERRQTVLGEIVSTNLVTWALVIGLATAFSVLLMWLLGGWMRVADRVNNCLGVLIAPRNAGTAAPDRDLPTTFESTTDEVDATTHAVAARLKLIADRTRNLAALAADMARDATSFKASLVRFVDDAVGAVSDASTSVSRADEVKATLGHDVESLTGRAEEASSASLEAVAQSDEVAESLHRFVGAFDAAAASGDEALANARAVAQRLSDLEGDARASLADAKELDADVVQVEGQVSDIARKTERHASNMAQAIGTFQEAARGIHKLNDVAAASIAAVGALGQKIGQITRALTLINDVAEETNLLSLNAAIIAAQAGEHGRAFGVVADEIKDLAERVGTSTREIAALVKAVVGESAGALRTIEGGVLSVQVAVSATSSVGAVLAALKESADGSQESVRLLVSQIDSDKRKVGGVAQGVGRLLAALDDVGRAVDGIVEAGSRAAQGDEGVRSLSAALVRAANEEVRNAKQVVRTVEKLNELGRRFGGALSEQARELESSEEALARARAILVDGRRLNGAVDELLSRIDRMGAEIARSEPAVATSLSAGPETV